MKFLPLIILSTAAGASARGGGDDNDPETDDYMGIYSSNDNDNNNGRGGRWSNNTSTSDTSYPKQQCRQLAQLTALSNLASDPSKLSSILSQIESSKDPSKAAAFQAQVSSAQSELTALQSNATLVTTCAPVLAEMEMKQACRTMAQMEKLASWVADPSKLAEKTDGEEQKAEEIKKMVEENAGDLAKMQGNETLTGFCSVLKTEDDCRKMRKLERMLSNNGTASAKGWGGGGGAGGGGRRNGHRGNDTSTAESESETEGRGENSEEKAQKWQAKVAEKQAELEELKGNSTLVEICAVMDSSDQGTTGGSSSSGGSSGSGSGDDTPDNGVVIAGTVGGRGLQPFGTMLMGLGTVFLFGLLVL
ncbi:hypothetical protein V8F20_000321 [Naviculisporaceae sp. PSN 640]